MLKKLSRNVKDSIDCLMELKRKTKDTAKKKYIDKQIRDIRSCYK
ncbi:MAG: hypothetical protein K0R06_51 [Clostridium sp.]|jgi:hypothetical protein|nr:hypothetical protein [Clostridium sp.]